MNVSSTLDAVTLYREGAVCERRAKVEVTGEPKEGLRFTGLPLTLSPGSLRARVVSGPPGSRVLDVRASWDVTLAGEIDVPHEQQALEKARDEVSRLRQSIQLLEHEIVELRKLKAGFPHNKEKGAPPREAPLAALVALADFSSGEMDARLGTRRKLVRELDDAIAGMELAERRLAEAGTAKRTERARLMRSAVVTLAESTSGPVELSLEYQVPGARWAPGYALQLDKGLGGGALRMRVVVGQCTGEDWTGVKLSLSTASLARRTDVPELKALKIGRTQPPRPRSGWREPPPGLDELFAAYDDASGHRPPQVPAAAVAAASHLAFKLEEKSRAPEPARPEGRYMSKTRPLPAKPMSQAMPMAPPPPPPPMAPGGAPRQMNAPVMARAAFVGGPPPAPAAAPAPMAKSLAAPMRSRGAAFGGGGTPTADMDDEGGAYPEQGAAADYLSESEPTTGSYAKADLMLAEPEAPGIDIGFLDYERLVMGTVSERSSRGKLRPSGEQELRVLAGVSVQVDIVLAVASRALSSANAVSGLALPALYQPVVSHQSFDYRYDCEQRVDVPSTGTWITVPVMTCDVGLALEHVCVPAVEPKVYRTLTVRNSSVHALLPGPVDVSAGDEFLLTASLPAIPPGATDARLGIGVEEAIKVARKTTFKESSGGFLGGSTVLPHEVEVEVNNRLSSPAKLEIRERVPVPDGSEKDVKVEETAQTPGWEKVDGPIDGVVTPGMRRWRLTVPAGQKQTLTSQYTIRIPADRMLVGGNRRV